MTQINSSRHATITMKNYQNFDMARYLGMVGDLVLVCASEPDNQGTYHEVVDLWYAEEPSGAAKKIARLSAGECRALSALLRGPL